MRLDQLLVQQGKYKSRDRAKEAIENGLVSVTGKIVRKPALLVSDNSVIELKEPDFQYVSRGGLKLAAALENFSVDVQGKIALDIGVATGGFTDCLLKAGAKKVYAVDIGKGQLEPSLLLDSRLIFKNQTDARNLQKSIFLENLDLIVIDVSFISLEQLIPAWLRIAAENTQIIALIKPQFEYGKAHSGVIKDKKIVQQILVKIKASFLNSGLDVLAEMPSPILGKEGNQEFLWLIRKAKIT